MPFHFLEPEIPHRSRADWTQAVGFHTLRDGDVLARVLEDIADYRGGRPVVLFDLDSTLYQVSHRTFKIFGDWHRANSAQIPKEVAEAFGALTLDEIGYSVADTFRNLGLSHDGEDLHDVRKHLRDFWFERFFTDGLLDLDRPYDGAREYVWSARDAGARLVYLTGRERAKMQLGTIRNLRRDGFPVDDDAQLVMRERKLQSDAEHKIAAANRFGWRESAVASFENEPKNLVALKKALPHTRHIFVDTVCSAEPAPLIEGIYLITGWK